MTKPRQNLVPLAIAGALVVLAIVFHARLLAWYTGDVWSASSIVMAGDWKISAGAASRPA